MVMQSSIDEMAQPIEKYRLTHDQSFNVIASFRSSVNNRVLISQLSPYRYGHSLPHTIHAIGHLRFHFPSKRLYITKIDWKSAYRGVHLHTDTPAVQSMVVIAGKLLLALRQTFGGASNPSQWSDISEIATDLANDLVRRADWNPLVHHSPHQHRLTDAHDPDIGLVHTPCSGLPPGRSHAL
jgi:hypothetical protein